MHDFALRILSVFILIVVSCGGEEEGTDTPPPTNQCCTIDDDCPEAFECCGQSQAVDSGVCVPMGNTCNSNTTCAPEEPSPAADTSPDVAPISDIDPEVIGPETIEEDTQEPVEVVEPEDVGPEDTAPPQEEVDQGPECVAPFDCLDKFQEELGECEEPTCVSGVCVIKAIEECCHSDSDCEQFLDDACCTTKSCDLATQKCGATTDIPGCCEASYQCPSDQDSATIDICAEACTTDGCTYLPLLKCDNEITYLTQDFNDPEMSDLTVSDTGVFDSVSVSTEKGSTVSPERSLYFGSAECQTYYTGEMENCEPTDFLAGDGTSIGLEVRTENVTLAYEEAAYLGFWVRMAAEPALLRQPCRSLVTCRQTSCFPEDADYESCLTFCSDNTKNQLYGGVSCDCTEGDAEVQAACEVQCVEAAFTEVEASADALGACVSDNCAGVDVADGAALCEAAAASSGGACATAANVCDTIYNWLTPTDYLRVSIDTGEGEPKTIWRSPDSLGIENTTQGEWRFQAVDLEPFKGKNVNLILSFIADGEKNFNTGDGESYYGAYVDDLIVRTACEACIPGSECGKDYDGCTSDTCVGIHGNADVGLCTYHATVLGSSCEPCAQPGDCGSDPNLDYTCDDGLCGSTIKSEFCEPFSSFPYDTLPGGVAVQSFEVIGVDFWSVDDPYPDDNIAWQVTDTDGYVGPKSLYFGDPASGTYEADPVNPAVGTIWSPSFQVSTEAGMPTVLAFWLNLSTEWDLVGGVFDPEDPYMQQYDKLTVYLHQVGEDEPIAIWESGSTLGSSTLGTWQQVGIDVTDWANKFVRIGFGFDSGEGFGKSYGNNFGGVYIDELTVSVYCETECLSSAVCDDGDTCTTNACVFGACETTQPDPDCCHVDVDCSHPNSCINTTCVSGTCEYQYSALASCCDEGPWLAAWSEGFEEGAQGWATIESTPPVVWTLSQERQHTGYWSYNFADPETGLYSYSEFDEELGVDIGQQTAGRLISPVVSVPPFDVGNPFAEFWLNMETEWDLGDTANFEPAIPVDELRVLVATGGNVVGAATLWSSHYLFNTTKGDWVHTYVDLADYRGEDIQLIFEFISGDGNFNDYAGAFLDDVSFGTTCTAPASIQCFDGGDCPNNDDCVDVICTEDFTCAYQAVDSPQCCEPSDIQDLAMTFEDDALTWEFTPCDAAETAPGIPVDPSATWKVVDEAQVTGIDAKYGDGMLYFGNGFDYGGGTGTASCGRAVSEPVTITESEVSWMLTYWVFMDIEPATDCDQGFGAPWLDVFTLEILDETNNDATLILVKDALLCSDYGAWAHQMWDLSPWVGSTIRFRVGFNSWDQDANSGKGIALDEFRFEKGCAEF
jgi:hypothetical protein